MADEIIRDETVDEIVDETIEESGETESERDKLDDVLDAIRALVPVLESIRDNTVPRRKRDVPEKVEETDKALSIYDM